MDLQKQANNIVIQIIFCEIFMILIQALFLPEVFLSLLFWGGEGFSSFFAEFFNMKLYELESAVNPNFVVKS